MSEHRGLSKVGYIRGFIPFLRKLSLLLSHAHVSQQEFDDLIEAQLVDPKTYCDLEGKQCAPDEAVVRLFSTPLTHGDNNPVFVSFERGEVKGTWVGAKLITTDGEIEVENAVPSFVLIEGGSLSEFEKELHSIAMKRPFLLAELRCEMETRGFRWTGKPKPIISSMKSVTIIQDCHPQPVDFLVIREKMADEKYLSSGIGFEAAFEHKTSDATKGIVAPSKDLVCDDIFSFAYIHESKYADLEQKALPENWTIITTQPFGVMIQYLKYTFKRACHQDGALVISKGVCACFNTGLVDRNYDWIYAYFEPNRKEGLQPWFLLGFFTAGNRGDDGLGKRAVRNITKLPVRVKWLTQNELYYNSQAKVYADWKHILQQRVARLPAKFVRRYIEIGSPVDKMYEQLETIAAYNDKYYEEISKHVNDLAATGDIKYIKYKDKKLSNWDLERLNRDAEPMSKLRKMLEDYALSISDADKLNLNIQSLMNEPEYEDVRFELSSRLNTAIELAKKKVMWDYATAVPIYYPERDEFGFLLPIALCNSKDVDVALVVSKVNEESYQGQTILTKEMAYSNARLLRRPDTQWISQWTENNH